MEELGRLRVVEGSDLYMWGAKLYVGEQRRVSPGGTDFSDLHSLQARDGKGRLGPGVKLPFLVP